MSAGDAADPAARGRIGATEPASATDANERADPAEVAERVRAALLERALAAHEDARLQGLCMEGAWEAAVSAIRAFDVAALVRRKLGGEGP
jgi:hypothetical protein